jgi:hypothetical protein
MVVGAEVRDPLEIARPEADETLSRLEFEIDLVADESPDPIYLIAVVRCVADSAVRDTPRRTVSACRTAPSAMPKTAPAAVNVRKGARESLL